MLALHRTGNSYFRRYPSRSVEQLPGLRDHLIAGTDADRCHRGQVRSDVRADIARLRHHLIPQHRDRSIVGKPQEH